MIFGGSIPNELSLQRLRLALLIILVHFFLIQPIINSFYPEFAERALFGQNLEENEDKDDLGTNRVLEEELLHSKKSFYCFGLFDQPVIKQGFTVYDDNIYSCSKAEVNTPPPES